jgi:predicted TIM-barrel fold metal-dependent hydrolase
MPDPGRPRLVDTHVHFWDPGRPEWYTHLSPEVTIDYLGGDVTGMKIHYDAGVYRREAGDWPPVDGLVHVSATTNGRAYLAETAWLTEIAPQLPLRMVLIGAVDPTLDTAGIAADLDVQLYSPLFRGVRVLEGLDYESAKADEVLRLLAERGLIFDLVTHPEEMAQAATALARFPEAIYVVEHTGWPWPDRFNDPDYFALWQKGMSTLAEVGENVHCKLSGLPMSAHDMDIQRMRPWIEHCLDVFGSSRCVIGSNFPVDRLFGDFTTLMSVYAELTGPLGAEGQQAVFAGNAARVYRISA